MHGSRRMVRVAVTTSALQLMLSLAEQRETRHLALTLAVTQAKTFELDPHPQDLTCSSQSHNEDLALGTLRHLTPLLRISRAPCVLELAKRASLSKHGPDPFFGIERSPPTLSVSEASN